MDPADVSKHLLLSYANPSSMLKVLLIIMLVMALIPNAYAPLLPEVEYCLFQGYDIEQEPPGTWWCVFDDGTRCDLQAFNDSRCGQEYVRERPCIGEGGQLDLGKIYVTCCNYLIYHTILGPGETWCEGG